MAKDILFTKSFLDDIADALPGAKVTRNAGVIVSIEHTTSEINEFAGEPPASKTGRGGAREGSGRKPDPDKRVILSCRVKQPTLRLLKETAEETGTGLGAVVDFIVEDYKRRTDAE